MLVWYSIALIRFIREMLKADAAQSQQQKGSHL